MTPLSPRSRRACAPSRRSPGTGRSTAPSCRAFPSSRSCRASASATTTSTPNGRAQHGVIVTNTPDVLNEEVADTALGLLLCTVRHLPQAERYLRAGQLAEARRLSAHPLAARPHRRHRRHGTHRQGDRAPARRHEGAGRLSLAPARRGRALPALSEPRRDGARRRCAARHHAGRRRDAQPDQCRGAQGARTRRHPDQRGARLGGRRGGADQGAARTRRSSPPASTCSPTSRRCRRN